MKSIEKAYQQCEKIIAHHSKTFYKAFSLLPKKQRNAVWAVYAFCRRVDDIVDEGNAPLQELQAFEQEFSLFKQGKLLHDDMWIALEDVFERFDMDVQPFDEMIVGQKMDLIKTNYETVEEVKHYSYHVASTVGLMLLPILAPKNHRLLREDGIALGIAMQITNILRDIGEDLERSRIYIPSEVMSRFGYTEEMLRNHEVNTAFISVWEFMAAEAEILYEQGLSSLHLYPMSSRIPLKGATFLYRAILKAVREQQYQVFGQKNFVTKEEKQKILALL